MFYFLVGLYSLLAIILRKHKLVLLFLVLQIVSNISTIVLEFDDYSSDMSTVFYVILTVLITLSIIIPWGNYDKITNIQIIPDDKFKKLSKFLFFLGGFIFIILLVVALYVNILITDINAFRHEDGMAMEFYYTMLPFDVRFFILAYSLYNFSYFFVPLHFYCLYIGDKKRAIVYFILSFNLVLYGLTFFSRWCVALFLLLYISHWICYNKLIPTEIRKKEIKWFGFLMGLLVTFFVFVTISRFENDTAYEKERVNTSSVYMSPTLFSVFDYLGQSNSISLYYFSKYNGNTFGGRYVLSDTQNFFSILGIVPPSNLEDCRDKIWTDYQGAFKTYACYLIFDVGIVGALLISLLLFVCIQRKGKNISFYSYLTSSVMLIVPICSIFFSYLNVSLFTLILFVFLRLFIKLA